MEECIVKYHYRGTLLRGGEVKFVHRSKMDFSIDPNKICYWDLLEGMKELEYDDGKSLKFFFMDDGILTNICDDESIVALACHLRRHCIVDVYVESFDKILPDCLQANIDSAMEADNNKENVENEDDNELGDDDDEERLVDDPFVYYILDAEEERN